MINYKLLIGSILLAVSCVRAQTDKSAALGNADTQTDLSIITTFSSSTAVLKSRHIPDIVFRMVHLKQLTITGSDCDYRQTDGHGNDITQCWTITEISPQIKKLKELESLQLNVNSIQGIPVELSELKNLKSLDLSDNLNLSDIDNVVRLENLESLGLYGCNLTKLPYHIGQLKKLKLLGLAGNKIDEQEKERIKKALPNCEIGF